MKKSSLVNLVLRRKKYLLDKEIQLGVLIHILSVMMGVAVLYALATRVFVSEEALAAMTAVQMRQFLLVVNSVYFILTAAIISALTVLLTHRFIGPVYVLRQAIQGMREGRYDRRLELRKKDYMKPLASDLKQLRSEIVAREEALRRFVEELEVALDKDDVTSARDALVNWRSERKEAVAEAARSAKAESEAQQAAAAVAS